MQTMVQSASVPNALDIHVGNRLRMRRTLLRISQEKLGEQIGVTFQQIQKYEKGSNRISAGHLFLLANFLKVDVNFFFEGLANGFSEAPVELSEIDRAAEGVMLSRAFFQISDPKVRRRLIELVTAIADGETSD